MGIGTRLGWGSRGIIAAWLGLISVLWVKAAGAKTAEDDDAVAGPVIISEVYHRPLAAHPRSEFVEVHNAGKEPVDIGGWRFTKGIRFEFPAGTRLAPGACAVVCEDPDAFRGAFGKEVALAGRYDGGLRGSGEALRLAGAAGKTAAAVHYHGGPPWPPCDPGRSLTRIRLAGAAADAANWDARAPSPGSVVPLEPPRVPLSIYGVRREPRSPAPGQPVRISVSVRRSGAAARVTLTCEVNGVQRTAPMTVPIEGVPAPPGKRLPDPVYTAAIPGQPAGAIVRYWIGAADGAASARLPPQGAASTRLAFYVQPPVETRLPFYTLLIEREALARLDANPGANDSWPAAVAVGGEVYEPVKVRYRGQWARSWPKKSWKVVFPEDHRPGKARRLNWNSSWRDPSYIREVLAYEAYRAAGALSVEARMVRVHLNGRFLGLYTEVESPRKGFLARHALRGGAVYKATSGWNQADERAFASAEEYRRHYSLETAREVGYEPLHRFCAGLAAAGDARAFLEKSLDVDRTLAYLGAGAFVQNWDSFNKNHYLVLDAAGSGKWTPAPWDLDRTLGDHSMNEFEVATHPLLEGTQAFPGTTGWNRLADRVLAEPSLRKRFEKRLQELLGSAFAEDKLRARVEALRRDIAPEADLDAARWGGWSGTKDWREGIDGVLRYLSRRREYLLELLPGGEPAPPRPLSPPPVGVAPAMPVVLRLAPFAHPDAKAVHAATRWEVREEARGWSTPAVDVTSGESLLRLELPAGVLRPATAYRWRASHIAASGKASEWSEEAAFTTGPFPFTAAPFDLSRLFNRDVVADPGDATNDPLDDEGGLLIVEGFDGTRADNPLAHGLPRDRRLGVHVLGDYSRPNAVALLSGSRPVRVETPRARYAFVRLVVAGGGDSLVPLTLEYAGGEREERQVPCDDWYDDNPPEGAPGSVRGGAVPLLNEMGRMRSGQFKDRKDPAVFEVSLAADAKKTLVAFTLDPRRGVFEKAGRARFHLLAATGIRLEP